MILDDVATALTTGGYKTTALYGTFVGKDQIMLNSGAYKRYLSSEKLDLNHPLAKHSMGEIEVHNCTLYVFAEKDHLAVENLKLTLGQILKTDRTNAPLGKGTRTVDYQGVRFWLFEPIDGYIKEYANFWQPPWGKAGGYWVADCPLRIAAKKL